MKNILVSIIIPVYNVENYVEKCINSCVNQSYRNIEIIVINDGTKDNSGILIDEISKKDARVKVIHKKNEGVSQARNDGIMLAKGDYVVFLDGDDYLKNDFIEYMLSLIKKTKADFCLSKNCFISNEQEQVKDKISILNNEDATALLLSPRLEVGCWNKIYKRNFLIDNNILFSKELFYGEGLHFITKASQLANRIGVGERRVYCYRKNNLTSATTYFNYKKFVNGEKALLKIKDELLFNDKKVVSAWELHYCLFCINVLIAIINNANAKLYSKKYNYWSGNIKVYSRKLIFNHIISIKNKIYIIIACLFPNILAKRNKSQRAKNIKFSV